MNKISITKLLAFFFVVGTASSQAQSNVQSRVEGTQRDQPAPISGQLNSQSSSNDDISQSDTGAQRLFL